MLTRDALNGTRRERRPHAARALAVLAAATVGTAALAPAVKADTGGSPTGRGTIVLHRGGHDATVTFRTRGTTEALLDLTAAASGVSWGVPGRESAVVSVYVDGRYDTDVVVPFSTPVARQFALGRLAAGPHSLRLHFAAGRSSPLAGKVKLTRLGIEAYAPGDPEYAALRFAPILYGRNLTLLGGPYENAFTDAPLVAWHEERAATTPGHKILEYSVIWSNEDGGTDTPALMARWGRTSDIEWIYRVELDGHGDRVPGSDVYQAPAHQTLHFAGAYEDDHPRLETCTPNNNVCDRVDDPMRFFLSALQTRPASLAREHLMDVNPWTYRVTALEMLREGRIELLPDPASRAVSDERNYLFVVVDKDTVPPGNTGTSWVGVALGVRLADGRTVYLSDHSVPDWSIQRDDPAATTVELPPGTAAADVRQIIAYRVVGGEDTGASVDVTGLNRGFFLDDGYLPEASFVSWKGDVWLTPAHPSEVLWSRAP